MNSRIASFPIRARSLLIALLASLLAACGRDTEPTAAPPPATSHGKADESPDASSWPVEVVDGLGRKVTVARRPERIVSLAPSTTELLHAVGTGDQIVGGTNLDNYPPEARAHASIGGMSPKSINLETVVSLRPDLVLATAGVQEPVIGSLERLGLTVVALEAKDMAGVAQNIRMTGRLTGHTVEANRLADRFVDRVDAVARRVAARTTPRPRVLYLVRVEPLMTAGPGTFIGQMIEAAGGTNVFGDVTPRFPRPSEEEILGRAPEIILTAFGAMNLGKSDDEASRQRLRSRPGWSQIPAIRDNRIEFLDEDLITRAGPRLIDGLEAVAQALETSRPLEKAPAQPAPE